MTFSEEYARMRPLEDDVEPATVWGCTHTKAFDPIPFLLRQSEKASHWVAAEHKFFKGPGSGKKVYREPREVDRKPREVSLEDVYAKIERAIQKAWSDAWYNRIYELNHKPVIYTINGIPFRTTAQWVAWWNNEPDRPLETGNR